MRKKKNAFTLIELVAVLVIMAIIALIVTPLVMNIVKKAKDSANKRSIDAYGKALELAVATYLLDNGDYPTTLDSLTVEYSGNKVVCNVKTLNGDGGVYLSECSVKGRDVKDQSTEDGWYHYGKTSATAYQSYNIGDIVIYNGMEFYVIEASDESSDYVTMLKAEPLTVDEVNTYGGVGTDNNHVNMYVSSSSQAYQTAYNQNGYGGMAYYTSETCGDNGSNGVYDGCTAEYEKSEIKYVVDGWTKAKLNVSDLALDSLGYRTRLLTHSELIENLGFERWNENTNQATISIENTPIWVYNSQYYYWTMSSIGDLNSSIWCVPPTVNSLFHNHVSNINYSISVVRPVVNLLKLAIE